MRDKAEFVFDLLGIVKSHRPVLLRPYDVDKLKLFASGEEIKDHSKRVDDLMDQFRVSQMNPLVVTPPSPPVSLTVLRCNDDGEINSTQLDVTNESHLLSLIQLLGSTLTNIKDTNKGIIRFCDLIDGGVHYLTDSPFSQNNIVKGHQDDH